jgi:hypothetical protein
MVGGFYISLCSGSCHPRLFAPISATIGRAAARSLKRSGGCCAAAGAGAVGAGGGIVLVAIIHEDRMLMHDDFEDGDNVARCAPAGC